MFTSQIYGKWPHQNISDVIHKTFSIISVMRYWKNKKQDVKMRLLLLIMPGPRLQASLADSSLQNIIASHNNVTTAGIHGFLTRTVQNSVTHDLTTTCIRAYYIFPAIPLTTKKWWVTHHPLGNKYWKLNFFQIQQTQRSNATQRTLYC